MRNTDLIAALYGYAKKGLFANHQERQLIRTAAKRIEEQDAEIRRLADAAQTQIPFAEPVTAGTVDEAFWED